jgi:uncharacterized phage protein (TIGR01671 family)
MREIKFRAWDKLDNEMHCADDDIFIITSSGIAGDFDLDYFCGKADGVKFVRDDDLILMQYTGLKDKNGKEIYEGDVLENKWGQKSKLEYGEFYDSGIYVSGFGISICPEESEVIGNIYENPELIK